MLLGLVASVLSLTVCLPAAGASATSIQVSTNPFLGEGNTWDGDTRVHGFIDVSLQCDEPGGVNPQEGGFNLTISRESTPPDWLVLGVSPAALELVPPLGPTPVESCDQAGRFDLSLDRQGEMRYDEPLEFRFAFTVEAAGDTGTFAAPEAPEPVTMTLTTASDPADDPLAGVDNGTGDEAPLEEGTPALSPLLALCIAAGGVALSRARRSR